MTDLLISVEHLLRDGAFLVLNGLVALGFFGLIYLCMNPMRRLIVDHFPPDAWRTWGDSFSWLVKWSIVGGICTFVGHMMAAFIPPVTPPSMVDVLFHTVPAVPNTIDFVHVHAKDALNCLIGVTWIPAVFGLIATILDTIKPPESYSYRR